jgi:hypothetical protein
VTKTADVDKNPLNRRGTERRKPNDRRGKEVPVVVERRQGDRREKVNRRRQIDPTTCERDYSDAEVEFMHALDAYKRRSGRMFPTCSEMLEVLLGLGYRKVAAPCENYSGEVSPATNTNLTDN